MLVQLSIQNVVLIDELVLDLAPGFNVITGETGAGKSMLIHALSLILGGRARPDVIRGGSEEAQVEGLFEIAPGSPVVQRLDAAGIRCERDLVVRRVVQAVGREDHREIRSRSYVNGRLCTAAQLSEIAKELCDIASQHESASLTDPATHVAYLDAFALLDAEREAVSSEVEGLSRVVHELEALTSAERTRAEREDFLRWQIHEIDELAPEEGEETELTQELERLRHAGKLQAITQRAAEELYDGQTALCDALSRLAKDLEQAATIDGSLAPHAQSVQVARSELADAARALSRYANSVAVNPVRLAEAEERLFRLGKLLRKHGPSTSQIRERRNALASELESLAGASQRIAELESEKARRLARAACLARQLSNKRREAAKRLGEAIGAELALLGMGRARVIVEVTPAAAPADALNVDGARLSGSGIDRVEFLIAPNRGEEPRPLRRIASGGELSRSLLALKRVLADKGPAGTYVFDEVDSGVSGAIAEVIGRSIADVARHRQVLCITHLPQVAALGDAHFVVDKSEAAGRTRARIRRLTRDDRVEEIARMIGGIKIGTAARQAAAELLAKDDD